MRLPAKLTEIEQAFKAMQHDSATFQWVERFNHRRLFEPIGDSTPDETEETRYLHDAWAKAA